NAALYSHGIGAADAWHLAGDLSLRASPRAAPARDSASPPRGVSTGARRWANPGRGRGRTGAVFDSGSRWRRGLDGPGERGAQRILFRLVEGGPQNRDAT